MKVKIVRPEGLTSFARISMSKPRVLVVYKESAYSGFLSKKQVSPEFKRGNYWSIVQGSHRRHYLTLKAVLSELKAGGFRADTILRDRIHRYAGADDKYFLVVSVGGDGTLLDASHHVREIPILGVNSDPARSVARFSGCKMENFREVFRDFLEGRLRPVPVARLEFSLNGRKSRWLVLNDLLVTTLSPAGTSRYVLQVGSKGEEQMSSGVWISTAAGSTAAVYSAGGAQLPATSKKFQFVVGKFTRKNSGSAAF